MVELPDLKFLPLYDPESATLQATLSSMAMLMLMSPGLSILIEELNGRLLPQMKLHGLKFLPYIIGNGIYCFLFPFISALLLLILKYIYIYL